MLSNASLLLDEAIVNMARRFESVWKVFNGAVFLGYVHVQVNFTRDGCEM